MARCFEETGAAGARVTGAISGFDRRLRVRLRCLDRPTFKQRYLCEARVRLFGFYSSRSISTITMRFTGASTQ